MPIYYEAKALERAIDAAPRITPSTKSVLKKIIRSHSFTAAERSLGSFFATGFTNTHRQTIYMVWTFLTKTWRVSLA